MRHTLLILTLIFGLTKNIVAESYSRTLTTVQVKFTVEQRQELIFKVLTDSIQGRIRFLERILSDMNNKTANLHAEIKEKIEQLNINLFKKLDSIEFKKCLNDYVATMTDSNFASYLKTEEDYSKAIEKFAKPLEELDKKHKQSNDANVKQDLEKQIAKITEDLSKFITERSSLKEMVLNLTHLNNNSVKDAIDGFLFKLFKSEEKLITEIGILLKDRDFVQSMLLSDPQKNKRLLKLSLIGLIFSAWTALAPRGANQVNLPEINHLPPVDMAPAG